MAKKQKRKTDNDTRLEEDPIREYILFLQRVKVKKDKGWKAYHLVFLIGIVLMVLSDIFLPWSQAFNFLRAIFIAFTSISLISIVEMRFDVSVSPLKQTMSHKQRRNMSIVVMTIAIIIAVIFNSIERPYYSLLSTLFVSVLGILIIFTLMTREERIMQIQGKTDPRDEKKKE